MTKYALLLGGTEFSSAEIQPLVVMPDLVFWKAKLEEKHGYDSENIHILAGRKFTVQNLVLKILHFAATLKADDYLTIIFSTHGGQDVADGRKKTYLFTFDAMISDSALFFLLKLFKPNTKIGLITDCCLSGNILKMSKLCEEFDAEDLSTLRVVLNGLPKQLSNKIIDLFDNLKFDTVDLGSKLWHMSSSYDDTVIENSFFKQLNEAFYNQLGTTQMPSVEDYRTELNKFVFVSTKLLYNRMFDILDDYDTMNYAYHFFKESTSIDLCTVDGRETLMKKENTLYRTMFQKSIKKVFDQKKYSDQLINTKLEFLIDSVIFYNKIAQGKSYPPLTLLGNFQNNNTIAFEN